MRAAYLLPLLALPAAAQLAGRHGDDEDDMMDMAHGDGHEVAATTTVFESYSSAASASASTAAHAAASSVPAPSHGHDAHHHNSHAPIKEYLDDADVHRWHDFPPTYLDADFRLTNDSAIFGEDLTKGWNPETVSSHPRLMLLHVSSMVLAYFGALPISLALRAAGHPSHYLANGVFLAVAIVGWLAGVAYKAAMPDMYEGAKHGIIGNILVLTSIALAVLDSMGVIASAVTYHRSGNRNWRLFFTDALHAAREDKFIEASRYEMVGLEEEHNRRSVFALGDDDEDEDEDDSPTSSGRMSPHSHRHSASRHSTGSDGTLRDTPTSSGSSAHGFELEMGADRKGKRSQAGAFDDHCDNEAPRWISVAEPAPQKLNERVSVARMGQIILTWVRRTQVVVAYVAVCTGIPIYVGMCRAGFINTCAAHIIKGSIFFGYGVLTFARYLGAYADLGWAWNLKPAVSDAVSAEMIECAVIFVYGITNTWMERFGSKHGDPYTVKQVQHISIAVMFWFAGLSGMLLESKRVRHALSAVLYTGRRDSRVRQPVSYSFSFNPLPALVIGITGLAMAAHHQDYKFQVEIHSLWGILLAGGSACRFLTYFFLWLRPPTESTLPSRPPTEVLTSFGWAAGGIVFMLSDEEVAFAAMRSGFDDMMAFLNLTIALTCFVFCWIVVVLGIKGYALFRVKRGVELTDEIEA